MEDKVRKTYQLSNFDPELTKQLIMLVDKGLVPMSKNSLSKTVLKILGIDLTLSGINNITLNKAEEEMLKDNYEHAEKLIGSILVQHSTVYIVILNELKKVYDRILYDHSTTMVEHKLDFKVEVLSNSLTHFICHRFSLIEENRERSIDFLLENVVIFAAIGGLAFKEGLQSLVDKLQNEVSPVTTVSDQLFIDLVYKKPGHPTNAYDGEVAVTSKR
jgi:hypothetical protein